MIYLAQKAFQSMGGCSMPLFKTNECLLQTSGKFSEFELNLVVLREMSSLNLPSGTYSRYTKLPHDSFTIL